MLRILFVSCLLAPLLAAPATDDLTDQQMQQQQQQGPPKECEKPFGEGKLTTGVNPFNFTVAAKQRSDVVDYKNTFKGAPIDMIVTFTMPEGTTVKAFALRCGLPFPVVQWQGTSDNQGKIVSCIAPQSKDTLIVKGNIGTRYAVSATPLLAAWANHNSLPVIYEMAIQGSDGKIYVAAYNGTIQVKETDYKLPERFFQPPPQLLQQMQQQQRNRGQMGNMQGGGMGNMGMQDPRFQQGNFQDQGGFERRRRDVADLQEELASLSDQEDLEFGN